MKIRYSWAVAACVMGSCLAGVLSVSGEDVATWDRLQEQIAACGVGEKQWSRLRVSIQKHGFDAASAHLFLQPTFQAFRESLPPQMVLDRVREGLAKGASAEQILQASERRRDCLHEATRLVEEHGKEYPEGAREKLMQGVTLALESGLPPHSLREVMRRGKRRSVGQLENVIEAGEMLHLNELGDEVVTAMMLDYLERDLRQTEMRRAMRSVIHMHRSGVQDEQIGRALWGKGAGERYGQTDRTDTVGPHGGGQGKAGDGLPPPVDGIHQGSMPGSGGAGESDSGPPDAGGTGVGPGPGGPGTGGQDQRRR